ncbi:MAG: SA1362 family protein [Bacillota bacterium]|nr:SA1362 family protein [Bacillota bacterium]MDP4170007.1 SA1362 family protein [Bacillota bacterium]
MAFLKNRIPITVVGILLIFAGIGAASIFKSNPAGFIQRIAVLAMIGLAIFFIFRRISNASPGNSEQKAFLKAARKSKKRAIQKSSDASSRSASPLFSPGKKKSKKKTQSHLTVIDGKKGKKKNRASF